MHNILLINLNFRDIPYCLKITIKFNKFITTYLHSRYKNQQGNLFFHKLGIF